MRRAPVLLATLLLAATALASAPDPHRGEQWYLTDVKWNTACPFGCGDGAIRIAIIDTGYDLAHEDLVGRFVTGWNAYNGSSWVWDPDYPSSNLPVSKSGAGHGTQVAGVLGAKTENGLGIAGMAHVQIMPILAVTNDPNDPINATLVAESIYWAANNSADVISMSLRAKTGDFAKLNASIEYAYHEKGVVLVAAAGNYNPLPGGSGGVPCDYEKADPPASHPLVITVAGTNPDGLVSVNSWWGPEVDIAAPMDDIFTTQAYDDRYVFTSGTSFATPQVAATAALILNEKPTLTPAEVKDILVNASPDIVRDPAHVCVGSPTAADPTMNFPKLDVQASFLYMDLHYP